LIKTASFLSGWTKLFIPDLPVILLLDFGQPSRNEIQGKIAANAGLMQGA
jgi:hypothetical protein